MPSAKKQVVVRPSEAQLEAWKNAATKDGASLNNWMCAAADAYLEPHALPASTPPRRSAASETVVTRLDPPKKTGRARTSLCEHRVPPDRFCKRCD